MKHDDSDPVLVGFSSSRNVTFNNRGEGEALGYTWGEWREMSEQDRNAALQEFVNELVDVHVMGDED